MEPCKVCGEPVKSKYGICVRTKECRAEYTLAYYAANPGYRSSKREEYRKANPIKTMVWRLREKCNKLGIPFDLTEDDIPPIPEFCPVLGIRLQRKIGKGPGPNSPSLDRIIPELGYVAGNVQWMSQKANRMKNDATPDELRMFAKWVFEKVA